MFDIFDTEDNGLDEARGIRHRVEYRGEHLYVLIFYTRCELFISSVGQDQDPLTGAALDATSRMVTLAWKSNTLDTVVEQLNRSSRSKKDLPGILARLLDETFEEEEG